MQIWKYWWWQRPGNEARQANLSKWSETGCRDSSGMYRNKNVKPWHLRGCISTCFHFLFFHKPSSLDLPPLPVTCSKWWLLLRLYFTSCLGQFPAFTAPSICHIVYANTEILEKGKDWGTSKQKLDAGRTLGWVGTKHVKLWHFKGCISTCFHF